MAVLTIELVDGYKVGESTFNELGLRELTPKDTFEAQLAAEKVSIINGRAVAYVSDTLMGLEMLGRQVEYIGSVQGPFSIKELLKLSPKDFARLQVKANELDALMIPETQNAVEAAASRGRSESTG